MKKVFIVLLMAFASNSNAVFLTGNDLYVKYQAHARTGNGNATQDDYDAAYDYMGYVTGVWDAYDSITICPSGRVTRGQISDIVGRGLRDNPKTRSEPASDLVSKYLSEAFPCKK